MRVNDSRSVVVAARNAALLEAEARRAKETSDAEIEHSETVRKLHERYGR
jgi:hypothetical protein